MAAQAALIADTIIGMKRALSRENDYSGPDEPVTQPTNRGNKLRTNASHVREGALGYINSEGLYKQRNPVRYDSEGDELDEDDEDTEADAVAAEDNPFSEVALENLLCPLKHPSELPIHPSMSHPYTSKALKEMMRAIEAKLHQERALLWRARNLHRRFLGDSCYMPCGLVETPEDRWNFAPLVDPGQNSQNIRDERNDMGASVLTNVSGEQGNGAHGPLSDTGSPKQSHGVQEEAGRVPQTDRIDAEMTNAVANGNEDMKSNETEEHKGKLKSEEVDAAVADLPHHAEAKDSSSETPSNDGDNPAKTSADKARSDEQLVSSGNEKHDANNVGGANMEAAKPHEEETDGGVEMTDEISPEPLRRMTTRAQTNAANPLRGNEPANDSPSPSTETVSTIPTPHPLFLVSDTILPDPNFGLPPNEAEDTRRLLWSYIQKQEETVRGFEHMLECLLRACRMKGEVWEWCKAEGHVGEMSDGEDWYDPERWGLAPGEELKKGADEDEIEAVDEGRSSGKRGRRRQ
ncbi:hypothetical protein MPDQ_006891 [Monascus purpureus]|uniref:Transcriptional regulatory protein RXT2 N-terminal domain-containing protein n=1 Tax=Monascus purpureus TaxID=5098 RepID=A0A507QX88_MONPU|nr:hypothetical protein MPDQ_006891 [Monascus purpureus]